MHYPLPLKFDTSPDPAALQQTIIRLRHELEQARAVPPSSEDHPNIAKLKAENFRLVEVRAPATLGSHAVCATCRCHRHCPALLARHKTRKQATRHILPRAQENRKLKALAATVSVRTAFTASRRYCAWSWLTRIGSLWT